MQNSACKPPAKSFIFEYKYYQEGDFIIGGLLSAHFGNFEYTNANDVSISRSLCAIVNTEEYRSILAFIFAVDEINNDLNILPNVTLGYYVYDTCGDPKKTLQNVLQILSGEKEAPNYSCMEYGEVAGFIGDSGFHTSHAMAQLLSLYKYTQINYGTTDPIFNDKELFPNFFRIAPDDWARYEVIVKCLQHFGWNWVGIITPSDGSGDMELRELSKMMTQRGICIEFNIKMTDDENINKRKMREIRKFSARVIIVCGLFSMHYMDVFYVLESVNGNITLILHESWVGIRYVGDFIFQSINCSFIITLPSKMIPHMNNTISYVNPANRPHDPVLEDIWLRSYHCLSTDQLKNSIYQVIYKFYGINCTEQYHIPPTFRGIMDSKPFYAYSAVYAMAHALQQMTKSKTNGLQQIRHYMKKLQYTDPTGEELLFNEKGDLPSKWSIANLVIYETETDYEFSVKPLTTFDELQEDQISHIAEEDITWKQGTFPRSRCNERCPPGSRRASKGGVHVCCYDCVPCSEGEMSNVTDSEICYKCPGEEWPDDRRVRCIPKSYDFLSYKNDIIVHIFIVTALSLIVITLFILMIFVYYWNTPIVKANNRTVSFILLVSILLSFLCVFLFLGRPVDITCMLRQTLFGIFFSTAVSSVLAKTVTVYIAFKATKPGSSWRKWVTMKVSNYVVILCSSIQAVICLIWLSVSPPYQEYDQYSSQGKIIIQCNEGSVIGFYSVLSYMGFLAAVSFILAFMVRTLPDSFNEAKYITFSMLIFCSVWIAMIPAYLCTKGKDMVVVELFSILSSCAGILGCIFFTKVHILLLKPNLNSRKCVLEKNNL